MPPSKPAKIKTVASGAAWGAASAGLTLGLVACGQILGVSGWVDVGASGDAQASGDVAPASEGGAGDGPVVPEGAAPDAGAPTEGGEAGGCASPKAGGTPGVLVHGEYCIDATETTMATYQSFLNDPTVDPSKGQPPECRWNTSYQLAYDPYSGDPQRAQKPVTAIDWCDALAFCTYFGKHLCGNRVDGGMADPTGPLTQSQWYYACAGPTGNRYPYGSTYDGTKCRTNLPQSAGAGVVPTATCQGSLPGLFDMSGNLAEWENSCVPGTTGDAGDDSCVIRGGTFFFDPSSVTCDGRSGGDLNPRNGNMTSAVTIRCCWSP